MRLCSCTNS